MKLQQTYSQLGYYKKENIMAKPLGIVAMLTLLISGPALADNHIDKSDIKTVEFTKTQIFFKMKDESIYKGDLIRPRSCPIQARGVKYAFNEEIQNSFVVFHKAGFQTCKFKNVERLA